MSNTIHTAQVQASNKFCQEMNIKLHNRGAFAKCLDGCKIGLYWHDEAHPMFTGSIRQAGHFISGFMWGVFAENNKS